MARPSKFEILDRRSRSGLTISIAGELDMSTAQIVSQHVDERLNDGVSELTLDLADIEFMDSSGLRLLIELNNRSQRQAWRLKLKPPKHESATLVLQATRADTALPFVGGVNG